MSTNSITTDFQSKFYNVIDRTNNRKLVIQYDLLFIRVFKHNMIHYIRQIYFRSKDSAVASQPVLACTCACNYSIFKSRRYYEQEAAIGNILYEIGLS